MNGRKEAQKAQKPNQSGFWSLSTNRIILRLLRFFAAIHSVSSLSKHV